jgi:hypothetical protein
MLQTRGRPPVRTNRCVVREQRPGVDGAGPCPGEGCHAGHEVGPVDLIPEEGAPLEPAHHHVVEGPRSIEAGLAGHNRRRLA